MKNFVAVSFCVLAALATSTKGDATSRLPGADGPVRADSEEVESGTGKRCCYIADIEMFLPMLFNGTEYMQHEANALIAHITRGCKGELGTTSNAQSAYAELRKAFSIEDTEDILEDEKVMKRKIDIMSCNVGDYLPLLPLIVRGTKNEKAAVYDLIMISIERCNAEFHLGDKYRHCELDKREKWRLFFKWMTDRYMERVLSGRKRVIAQQLQ